MATFEQRESIRSAVYLRRYKSSRSRRAKGRSSWKWVKRQTNRYMRRQAKQRLEDAPLKKPLGGYEY